MATYLSDFVVEAEIVVAPGIEGYEIELLSGHWLTLENGPLDAHGNIASILATIRGEASSLTAAADEHRTVLAKALDMLAFMSHARFTISTARLAIEWDADLVERKFILYGSVGLRYPSLPDLRAEYVQNLDLFHSAPSYIGKALRHFRYGLIEDAPEDQFVRLWLALEILAVKSYDHTQRSPIKCRACGEAALCAHCKKPPPKMQSSKEPIESLVRMIVGAKAEEVYTRLFKVRNALMHGKEAGNIAAEVGVGWDQIIRVIGRLTWQALYRLTGIDTLPPKPVTAFAGDFLKKDVVVHANGALATPDGNRPNISGLRDAKLIVTGHLSSDPPPELRE